MPCVSCAECVALEKADMEKAERGNLDRFTGVNLYVPGIPPGS
jgi:hypothetical protein